MIFCFLFDSIIGKFKTSKVKHFTIIPKTDIMPENYASTNIQKNLSVLITGGSGLIGKYLTATLQAKGYKVSLLSRNIKPQTDKRIFFWDPLKKIIDPESLDGIDFIIHLTGANIGEKRWTSSRKKEILESRVESARFLHANIVERGIPLKVFISASATGIYGSGPSTKIFNEQDPPSTDFLGSVCKQWEQAADMFGHSGIRTVKIRTAVVLEKNDSALSKLMMPGKFGFLIQTGKGSQYMPWIHINDLCNIYLKAIEDPLMNGAYNAVAPQHVTHSEFIHLLAKTMRIPVFPLPVPGFILRSILGEMSVVILKGNRVSSEKLQVAGYSFLFSSLKDALENVLGVLS
jgi:uncharacterized protein (TIGR01777 family)